MATVNQLLRTKGHETWTISPDATVFEALEKMAEKNIGALPVTDENGKLVGIFSERDYARKVILAGKSSKETQVSELMTPRVFCIKPSRSLEDAMMLMTDKKIRHLPVLDEGNLTGIVTIGDIVKAVINRQANTIRELESYIAGTY